MATPNPVVVERVIDTSPAAIFELLATPARHHEIDGSGQVIGRPRGPERLYLGAEFSMRMKQGRLDYRSTNQVTEFLEGSRITWRTFGLVKDRRLIGGQTWRWILAEQDGATLVRHEYDWKSANASLLLRLAGYPERTQTSMTQTLERLDQALTGAG